MSARVTIDKTGDWQQAYKAMGINVQGAVRKALAQEAEFLADGVLDALRKGPHAKLSPLTLRARKLAGLKGTKPLQATGDLAGSIAAVKADASGDAYHVGVPQAARRKAGAPGPPLVRLAEIHEFGKTIVVKLTPAMRKYLFGVLLKGQPRKGGSGGSGKTGILVIHIPARPFIRPAFDKLAPTSLDRFSETLRHLVKALAGG